MPNILKASGPACATYDYPVDSLIMEGQLP